MTLNWAEPTKGKHVFVILRRDEFIDDPIESITGTKAFVSKDHSDAEADRLNAVNEGKRAHYFVRMARLQDDAAG